VVRVIRAARSAHVECFQAAIAELERQTFVPGPGEVFSFRDIIACARLLNLREKRVPPSKIGQALTSFAAKVVGCRESVIGTGVALGWAADFCPLARRKDGSGIGQLLLDFDAPQIFTPTAFASRPKIDPLVESEHYFQQGLTLEETGAPITEAMAAYEKAIELNSRRRERW